MCRGIDSERSHIDTYFFFNDTATTEIYTLSLHDALPISRADDQQRGGAVGVRAPVQERRARDRRSEEHTSELQSPCNLVCRLLLEKKNMARNTRTRWMVRKLNHNHSAMLINPSPSRVAKL